MNYTPIYGWYYIDSYNRSPSWTSVRYLYEFLVNNKKAGPFGKNTERRNLNEGDIIQLGNSNEFYHSLMITKIDNDEIYIAAHDFNAYMRNLNTYVYEVIRYIHIDGVNS